MADQHLSSQFASDLTAISTRLMEMGGLVESQVMSSIEALARFDVSMADRVIAAEPRVNQMEVEIDRALSSTIGRRQPTARDLRLLMAVSKTITNLERVGDEADKIARMVKKIIDSGTALSLPSAALQTESKLSLAILRKSLDALARLDTQAALATLKDDDAIDREFDGFTRVLVTYMMEDPRKISASLDLLTIAKSIERVGDHAKNIAEAVIYIVKGEDVRHAPIEVAESAARE
jgi:phosphate transport system protein